MPPDWCQSVPANGGKPSPPGAGGKLFKSNYYALWKHAQSCPTARAGSRVFWGNFTGTAHCVASDSRPVCRRAILMHWPHARPLIRRL